MAAVSLARPSPFAPYARTSHTLPAAIASCAPKIVPAKPITIANRTCFILPPDPRLRRPNYYPENPTRNWSYHAHRLALFSAQPFQSDKLPPCASLPSSSSQPSLRSLPPGWPSPRQLLQDCPP